MSFESHQTSQNKVISTTTNTLQFKNGHIYCLKMPHPLMLHLLITINQPVPSTQSPAGSVLDISFVCPVSPLATNINKTLHYQKIYFVLLHKNSSVSHIVSLPCYSPWFQLWQPFAELTLLHTAEAPAACASITLQIAITNRQEGKAETRDT